MKRWLFPTGVERDYLAGLRRLVVRPLEAAVRENIMPILGGLRTDGAVPEHREDVDVRDIPEATGWFEELRRAFVAALVTAGVSTQTIEILVRRIMNDTDTFNRNEWRAVLRSVYGVDVITTAPPGQRIVLAAFEAENIALIKSIPNEALSRMYGKVLEGVRTGRTLANMKNDIRNEFGVTDRRAQLIARDQIGKLNGQLTQLRQQQIGVDEYTWRGILDSRERPEHVAREGKVFRWSNPPPDGHPGQPIRCRCTADPVLPSWEALEQRITGQPTPAGVYL